MGDPVTTSIATSEGDSWASVLKSVLPVAASVYQQDQLMKMNLERVKHGQQPITGEQFASLYQMPTAQVQVGPSRDAQMMLMIGGAALLAVLFFSRKAR